MASAQDFGDATVLAGIAAAQRAPGAPLFIAPAESIGQLLIRRTAERPEQEYLVAYNADGGRHSYTYARFLDRVEGAARFLYHGLGLRRGDRLATVLHNEHSATFVYFAAWYLGVTVVPINVEDSPARKEFILHDVAARACFTLPEHLVEVQAAQARCPELRAVVTTGRAPAGMSALKFRDEAKKTEQTPLPAATADLGDEALIVYTSGTTGKPKGVVLSHRNILANCDSQVRWFGMRPAERWMCVLSIHHVNGIVVSLLSSLYAGGTVVLNRRFSVQTFWERLAAEGCRMASLVPTLLEFLLEAGEDISRRDLSALQGLICSAGPLLVETVQRFEARFGVPVYHGYGLSESTAYACMTPVDLPGGLRRRWYTEHGFPSVGTAMPYCELSIQSPEGSPLPAAVRGEICLRGEPVMQGYYRCPDANSERFRGGWFRSGDEGFWLTGPGGRPFFFITGRIEELIIRGGVNLSPLEIDEALRSHPAVQFGMALPFANRVSGEEVAAYVVLRKGFTGDTALAAAIQAHCRRHLAFPYVPKVVLFGTEVPYTSTGKPRRLELARQLAEQLAPYRDRQFRPQSSL